MSNLQTLLTIKSIYLKGNLGRVEINSLAGIWYWSLVQKVVERCKDEALSEPLATGGTHGAKR